MDKLEKAFRKVYPEAVVEVLDVEHLDEDRGFVKASFPDGIWWFGIAGNTVSRGYTAYGDCKDSIKSV